LDEHGRQYITISQVLK